MAIAVVLFITAGLFVPFVCLDGMLVIFHLHLLIRGITTYEYFLGHKPTARGALLIREGSGQEHNAPSDESPPVKAISKVSHTSSTSRISSIRPSRSISVKDLLQNGYHNFVASPMPAEAAGSEVLTHKSVDHDITDMTGDGHQD